MGHGENLIKPRATQKYDFEGEIAIVLGKPGRDIPADALSTGTPAGVGRRREPPLGMKAGDVIEVEAAGLGVLRNTVPDE